MKIGSTVTLVYKGTLDDGTLFGVATEEQPLEFQTGMDMVIPGLEKAVLEMNEVGEKKTFKVGMYDAYGEYLEDNFSTVPRELVTFKPKKGKRIWVSGEGHEKIPATVAEVNYENVVIDMNHPLAGKDLNFEIEILKIEDAPENFIPLETKRKQMAQYTKAYGFDS